MGAWIGRRSVGSAIGKAWDRHWKGLSPPFYKVPPQTILATSSSVALWRIETQKLHPLATIWDTLSPPIRMGMEIS